MEKQNTIITDFLKRIFYDYNMKELIEFTN